MSISTGQIIGQQRLRRPIAWVIWGLVVTYVVYKFQTQSSYVVLNSSIAESLSLSLSQVGELWIFASEQLIFSRIHPCNLVSLYSVDTDEIK